MSLRIHPTAAVFSRTKSAELGFTLVEVMVSTILVAIFFASIFEINAMCLRTLDRSKMSCAAWESGQDCCEVLRIRSFADLTTAAVVQTTMPAPATQAHLSRRVTGEAAI